MARQSNRSKAKPLSPDEPAAEVQETADEPSATTDDAATAKTDATAEAGADAKAETPDEAADDAADTAGTTAESEEDDAADVDPGDQRALWEELRIDPVEIALPGGTGFTLRALSASITA